jgi:hypothetical protein
MGELVTGSWNTLDLLHNVLKVKFSVYAAHVINYITKSDVSPQSYMVHAGGLCCKGRISTRLASAINVPHLHI